MATQGWDSQKVMRAVAGAAVAVGGLGATALGMAGVEPAQALAMGGLTALALGIFLAADAFRTARSGEERGEEELPTLGQAMERPSSPESEETPAADPAEPARPAEPFESASIGWGHKIGDGGPGAGLPGHLPGPDGGADGG